MAFELAASTWTVVSSRCRAVSPASAEEFDRQLKTTRPKAAHIARDAEIAFGAFVVRVCTRQREAAARASYGASEARRPS